MNLALVPLRHERRLVTFCKSCTESEKANQDVLCQDCYQLTEACPTLPWVVVTHLTVELGKYDLLKAMTAACGCCPSGSCGDCGEVIRWARTSIPSCLLRLCTDRDDSSLLRIWVRAASYATMGYVHLLSGTSDHRNVQILGYCTSDCETWMGPWIGRMGDVLRFLVVPEHAAVLESNGTGLRSPTPIAPLEFQLCRLTDKCETKMLDSKDPVEDRRDNETHAQFMGSTHHTASTKQHTDGAKTDQLLPESSYAVALRRLDETLVELVDESVQCDDSCLSHGNFNAATTSPQLESQAIEPPLNAPLADICHLRDHAYDDVRKRSQSFLSAEDHRDGGASFVGATGNEFMSLQPDKIQKCMPNSSRNIHGAILKTSSSDLPLNEQESVSENMLSPGVGRQFKLFFVEKGNDMHRKTHLVGLQKLAEQRGATVLNSFDKSLNSTWPTHLVASQKVSSIESIAAALNFSDLDEMSIFLSKNGITCATREWVTLSNAPLQEPTMLEQILGLRRRKPCKRRTNSPIADSSPLKNAKQRQDEDALSKIWNVKLSELFRKIGKLHQECPLYENDDWKAYMFHLLGGRLRNLGFEVTHDPNAIVKLEQTKGFGASSIQVIKEFLETGTSTRIRSFETDKLRVAMKAMMNIWGVGRVTATELVKSGYTRIGLVRQAVKSKTLKLERNQYIGVLCYEDFLEEMTRDEAKMIAEIVEKTVKNRFPSAEITIMGSYRRGKLTCGDVDILITHPDFKTVVSPKILGVIVDELRASGHAAYHLTFIPGMKHELFETLPFEVANKLKTSSSYGRSNDKDEKNSSSSWMGVFYSPLHQGKHRRVDIKFYPYTERIFASLYFTGNGHFNRSMRLWATRKFGFMLSDHSLCDKDTKLPVLENPSCERSVFEFLRLKWKEPSERDCFDAIEIVPGETSSQTAQEFSRKDISDENTYHVWIK